MRKLKNFEQAEVHRRLTENLTKAVFLFFRFLRRELHEYPTPLEAMEALETKPAGVPSRLSRYLQLDFQLG
jgi:hypothetical protein